MNLALKFSETELRDEAYAERVGSYVGEIIDALAAPVGGADEFVEGFIVTDDDCYGAAIVEASQKEGFTNDGYFLGVGKTVRLQQEARPVSRIVVRIWLVEHLLNGGYAPGSIPTDDMWLALFAIAHELGHAVDNERRKLVGDVEGTSDPNSLRRWRTKGPEFLLDEIAAQRFASAIVTKTAFEQQRLTFDEDIERIISEIYLAKTDYNAGAIDVDSMATIGSQGAWRLLDLLAKCRVLQLGLSDAERGPPLKCEGLKLFGSDICREFELLIDEILMIYPAEPADIKKRISDVWADILALLGVDFEERERGFGLRIR
jgi:hypothetical protein